GGIWAVVSCTWPGYWAAAFRRFDTCVFSVDWVIRWFPTIAAAPTWTGEHADSSTPAPSAATPPNPATRAFLPAAAHRLVTGDPLDTDSPFHQGSNEFYDSESTER